MKFPAVERFTGCLVGQCVADAVAQSVADLPGEICRDYWDKALARWWCQEQAPSTPQALQYSEGAQLAVVLGETFIQGRSFSPAVFAARIEDLIRRRCIVRRSWETYKAAKNLSDGIEWRAAGIDLPGAGAAQRSGFVGLLYFHDARLRQQVAMMQGQITNRNASAIAGAVVVAEAVSQLAGDNVEEVPFLDKLAISIETLDANFSRQLRELPEWLKLSPGEAAAQISSTAPADPFTNVPGGIPLHVVPVVLWSLYAVLRSDGQFSRAIELALYPGGNVVATASIVGACSGSQVGLTQLPASACQQLVNGNRRMLEELVELSRACHQIVAGTRPAAPTSGG